MRWIRLVLVGSTVATGSLFLTVGGTAAQKVGCPAGTWEHKTIQQVAVDVWPTLIDTSPWPGGINDFRDNAVAAVDKNDSESICTKTMWGEELNPKSAWYTRGPGGTPTVLTVARDDNANGDK